MKRQNRKVEWSLDFDKMRVRAGQFVSDDDGRQESTRRAAALAESREGANSARVEIDFSIGPANLNALAADTEDLFQAQLKYIGEIDFAVSGGAERSVKLRQRGALSRDIAAAIGNASDLRWEIGLAQNLPLRMKLKGGVGATKIDLSRLQVHDLQLHTGVGEVVLTLPENEHPVAAEIRCGVGKTVVTIMEGACGSLKIRGGVGECALSMSPAVALRLDAKTGLGQVQAPEDLLRQGERKTGYGLWESDGFVEAERQISIEYRGGIGSLNLSYL